jgi:hypothetical protein
MNEFTIVLIVAFALLAAGGLVLAVLLDEAKAELRWAKIMDSIRRDRASIYEGYYDAHIEEIEFLQEDLRKARGACKRLRLELVEAKRALNSIPGESK